jgi:hypothetical protein
MKKLLLLILFSIPVLLFAQTATVTLQAQASDSDGTISSYKWVQISGTANATIAGANSSIATVTFNTAGHYVFQCTVTDNSGAGTSALVPGDINPPANKPPVLHIVPETFNATLK